MENEEKNQTEQDEKGQSVWKELWDYAKIILVVFVIAFLLGHFVYINARVPSGSMEETIMTGDRVFGNRLAYVKDDPKMEKCISTIQKSHWMTAFVQKHRKEALDRIRSRKDAISC